MDGRPKALPIKDAFAVLRQEFKDRPLANVVLGRLEQHSDTEVAWRKISEIVKPPDLLRGTIVFFRVIVKCRLSSEKLNQLMKEFRSRRAGFEQEEKSIFALAKKNITRGVSAAKSWDQLRMFMEEETAELRQIGSSTEVNEFPNVDVRSDKNGSHVRRSFIRQASKFVQNLTNKRLHDEVAKLTSIVFQKTVTAEAVRAATQRPTTREGRSRKGK